MPVLGIAHVRRLVPPKAIGKFVALPLVLWTDLTIELTHFPDCQDVVEVSQGITLPFLEIRFLSLPSNKSQCAAQ